MSMVFLMMAAYIAAAGVLAYVGRRTRIGPLILFLVGLFVTPLVPAVYVLVARIEERP